DLDRIIRIHNASDKRRIDMGVDENGTRRYALSDGVYTCVGDPRHAINKLHYMSRKKQENFRTFRSVRAPQPGEYFWFKEHIKHCEYAEPEKQLKDKFVFKAQHEDGFIEYFSFYKNAIFSKQQKDYIWSAKYLHNLAEKSLRNSQRHDTQGQRDCYGYPVNRFVWQPTREEVFTEITGADLFNEKIRNSRNRKTSPEDTPEPIVTDEDRETLRILHQQARDQIYRYREAQKDLETDNRTDLEKTYNGIFDKIYGRKNSHTSF
ncbi:MAG: hypothetical protein KKA79_07750, partial [Nanoarchaeota archaeon]|nr:hypothetical protein [Nanoarchaeota archaeon]